MEFKNLDQATALAHQINKITEAVNKIEKATFLMVVAQVMETCPLDIKKELSVFKEAIALAANKRLEEIKKEVEGL